MHGNYGGTKKERAEAAQKLLLAATPEQKAVFTDTDPLLIEGIKAFNITFSVQAQAYSILKASVSSDKPQCDSMANRRADEIINKSRDDLIACLATFRNKILVDGKGFMDIRDVSEPKENNAIHLPNNIYFTFHSCHNKQLQTWSIRWTTASKP